MQKPRIPDNEQARLRKLEEYAILDTAAEPAFDDLTALAAHIAGTPIALVSLIDADRQWFKSRYGLEAPETPRDISFCGHVVASESSLIVKDAFEDERFHDNPLVVGEPRVRFYAGMPLRTSDGFVLGSLCAIGHEPRQLDAEQQELLGKLARQVVSQLELRRQALVLASQRAQLEIELSSSAEVTSRLRGILASANLAVIETSPDGTIREFNAAASRMLGYDAAELVGRASPGVFHDPEEVVARAEQLSRELGVSMAPGFEVFVEPARRLGVDERDWSYLRKDGTRLPVHLSVTPRLSDSGEVLGYLGIARDITERREAEEALAQRAALLRLGARVATAFSGGGAISDMLSICSQAMVEELDAAFARIWLLDASENVLVLTASSGQYTHLDGPHGRVPVGEFKIGRIAASRQPHLTNQVLGDPEVGDQDWARREKMVSFAGYPMIIDESLIGVMAIFARHPLSQTTLDALQVVATNAALGIQRKEAEARLRESEAHSRTIIETAVDAVITIDERGVIGQVNPAGRSLFGYELNELAGKNVSTLMPSPDREQHDGYLAHYAKTGERKIIGIGREVTALKKDGSLFPGELSVSEFFIDGKKFFTGVVRDISDRKRIERLQSEFVSTVSHELRTPLTSIRGSLGLVAAGITGELPAEAKEYVDIALNNSDRLVRLINDILDMEKMQSGKMDFRLEAVSLGPTVASAVASNAAFASARGVSLRLDPGIPAGEVLVDPDRLAQVFTNLISNAVKFSPPGEVVELGVTCVDERFRVTVRDRGPGIPEEFRSRIFQRFAQADGSSTRAQGGTGLGLSICKAIIETMRGEIGFEAAEGGGTVFYFELPYLAPVEAPAAVQGRANQVLVCEDDPDAAQVLGRLLRSAGFDVFVAPTLERARRLLAQQRFALVTLDLQLADGDGALLIAEMRGSAEHKRTPIVVVSGSNRQLGPQALMVNDVLVKPFEESRLLSAVESAVAGSEHPRLLVVEDDADVRRVVQRSLPEAWKVVAVETLAAARHELDRGSFDVVLLDLTLPDGAGEELIDLVGAAEVIIFSARDADAALSARVAAALVKSRSNPSDLKDLIVGLLEKRRRSGGAT